MVSVTQIKNKLPEDFVDNLYEMFSPITVDNIFRGIAEKRYTTLRVNTLKYNIQDLMRYFKDINIKFERVLWYKDALVVKNANEKEIRRQNFLRYMYGTQHVFSYKNDFSLIDFVYNLEGKHPFWKPNHKTEIVSGLGKY